MGKSCGKFLQENLAGNSCGKWRRGKSQFKKDNDWWKFSIWNRVMGSQPISIQLRKILRENLAGNCCGKILRKIVAGKSCGKLLRENLAGNSLRENLAGNSCGKWRRGKSQLKKDSDWWKFTIWNMVMGRQPISIQLRKILWENLVGNCCGKILREIVAGKSCGKLLRENLAGNSCGKWRRGKSQFKKDSDWWKFSIWNRVMGSQPISIQLRKILRENLAGNCCGKILRKIVAGKSCGKLLREILAGNSLRENLAGNSCGKWRRGKSQFKKDSDWWKFTIWNMVMGRQPISIQLRKILRENLAGNCLVGKSCRKFLRENLAGKCCGKFLQEILVGNGGGEKANLRKTVIGGNLAFGIG